MNKRCLLLLGLLSSLMLPMHFLYADTSEQSSLEIVNNCDEDVWIQQDFKHYLVPDGQTSSSERDPFCFVNKVNKGNTLSFSNVPKAGLAALRFAPKLGCDENGFNCRVGDSLGYPSCEQYAGHACKPGNKSGEICKNLGYNPATQKMDKCYDKVQNYLPQSCLAYNKRPANGFAPAIDSLLEITFGCLEKDVTKCNKNYSSKPKPSFLSGSTYWDLSFVDGFTVPAQLQVMNQERAGCFTQGSKNKPGKYAGLVYCGTLNTQDCKNISDTIGWSSLGGLFGGGARTPKTASLAYYGNDKTSGEAIGCYSPCSVLTKPSYLNNFGKSSIPSPNADNASSFVKGYCCPDANSPLCQMAARSNYVKYIHQNCGAYAWQYDDALGNVKCADSKAVKLRLTLCPQKPKKGNILANFMGNFVGVKFTSGEIQGTVGQYKIKQVNNLSPANSIKLSSCPPTSDKAAFECNLKKHNNSYMTVSANNNPDEQKQCDKIEIPESYASFADIKLNDFGILADGTGQAFVGDDNAKCATPKWPFRMRMTFGQMNYKDAKLSIKINGKEQCAKGGCAAKANTTVPAKMTSADGQQQLQPGFLVHSGDNIMVARNGWQCKWTVPNKLVPITQGTGVNYKGQKITEQMRLMNESVWLPFTSNNNASGSVQECQILSVAVDNPDEGTYHRLLNVQIGAFGEKAAAVAPSGKTGGKVTASQYYKSSVNPQGGEYVNFSVSLGSKSIVNQTFNSATVTNKLPGKLSGGKAMVKLSSATGNNCTWSYSKLAFPSRGQNVIRPFTGSSICSQVSVTLPATYMLRYGSVITIALPGGFGNSTKPAAHHDSGSGSGSSSSSSTVVKATQIAKGAFNIQGGSVKVTVALGSTNVVNKTITSPYVMNNLPVATDGGKSMVKLSSGKSNCTWSYDKIAMPSRGQNTIRPFTGSGACSQIAVTVPSKRMMQYGVPVTLALPGGF